MYAIVESGGKQYKAEKGETLLLDRLSAKEGEKVDLRAVLFRDSDVVTDPDELGKVKVEATVSEHLRGPKLRVFKYKPKKGYRRRAGHRSELTRVEITEIRKLSRKPAARKAEPKGEAETAAAPKAEPKKPATRKTGTTRKTSAKKAGPRKSTTRKTSTRRTSGSSSSRKGSSSGS